MVEWNRVHKSKKESSYGCSERRVRRVALQKIVNTPTREAGVQEARAGAAGDRRGGHSRHTHRRCRPPPTPSPALTLLFLFLISPLSASMHHIQNIELSTQQYININERV